MGQQQLIFIAVGMVLVMIALYFAITNFVFQSATTKRDGLISESMHLVVLAQHHYKSKTFLGEKKNSFTNWTIPKELVVTGNGRFEAQVYPDSVVILGIGNEVLIGTDDSVKISTTVFPTTFRVDIIN